MTKNREKGVEQAMDRVLYAKSASSPPTPAASSAGASSPAIPANVASIDWCGLGKVRRGGSFSRTSGLPPWAAGGSTSTAGGSTPGSSQPSCRPWDRGDLLKRLATFNSSTWFAKPKVTCPLACAKRGWVNVDVDFIACEACGARLSFPTPSSWSQHQVEIAAESFGAQLDCGHKALCPWRGNCCPESLGQFSSTTMSALIGGYADRCDALLQLSAIPVISGSAIDHLKLTRGPLIDRLLARPLLFSGRDIIGKLEDGSGAECSRQGPMYTINIPYFQALRLISLCGWEPRVIPHTVDCEENSAHSERNAQSARLSEGPPRRICDPGPSELRHPRTGRLEKKASVQSVTLVPESRCNPASAVLECNLCGASLGLWNFVTVARPSSFLGSTLAETPELQQNNGVSLRGVSAASGIDGWHTIEVPLNGKMERMDDAGDVTTTDEQNSPPRGVVLDLNLAIAGAPTPALRGSFAVAPFQTEPPTDNQVAVGQSEGSEMGGRVASYESFGPRGRHHRFDDGGSTVDRPQSKMHLTYSIEGTVVDHVGDEVNDGEVSRVRICRSESSGHKRARESSADPQLSYDVNLTNPECTKFASVESEHEAEGSDRTKKNRFSLMVQEYYDQKRFPTQPARDSAYDTSVIAVDTTYSELENSTESVENYPQDNDAQGTSFTREKSEKMDYEELTMFEQAQQSSCQQFDIGRADDQPSEPGLSTSDERGGDLAVENDVTVFSAVAGQGFSLGISGGSVQMVASHEAEIHGADLSVYKTDSIAGEAELVTEVTENQIQTSGSVRDRVFGECVPEDVERTDVPDVLGNTHEAAPSFSVARGRGRGMKFDGSVQGESWGSEEEKKQGAMLDHLTDTGYGVVPSGPGNYSVNANMTGQGIRGAHSVITSGEHGRVLSDPTSWDHEGEFDPIQQHHNFCPWVNCYVAAAVINYIGSASALCGWQLTIDALDVSEMQEDAPTAPMESESAASMHKGNTLTTSQLGSKGTQSKSCEGACVRS